MTRRLSLGLAIIGATLIGCAASQAAGTALLYDNTSNTDPMTSRFRINSGIEIGDEVFLDLNRVKPEEQKVGAFSFQYYGLNFSGTEKVRVRFYNMNSQTLYPSTLIWDSGLRDLPGAPGAAVMTFEDFVNGSATPLTDFIPANLMWSVEFSGLAVQAEAGLDIYTPPTIGNNLTSYWQKFAGGWSMMQMMDVGQQPVTVDFGAQFAAVPEPSTVALGLLGLAGLLGVGLKRRFSR